MVAKLNLDVRDCVAGLPAAALGEVASMFVAWLGRRFVLRHGGAR